MTTADPPSPFFVAGGTVPPGAPSYVERAADRELLDALLAGEFCYVLNSRQMGKSSLAVRTIAKLNETGVRTAFVDLTRLGATGADPERWYTGLLMEIGRAVGMRAEAMAYLKANPGLPPANRLFSFLREGVLSRVDGPLVVFIDEVDATRTLPFSADDLFAGIRQTWNARADDPAYGRLAFCLMGAALPSDLIRDPRITPFNVGRRIDLRDFTPEEARPFAAQVGAPALGRVLRWTGGHPFLTQALCAALASPGEKDGDIDALVRDRYLAARETDTNLADVARRLLGEGDPSVDDATRADTLSLYERMLRGRTVADDEANPAAARIKMSGVARAEDGNLRLRNRIYGEAFDARWVRDNLPGGEIRRQRRAFWRGALRTGLVSAAVIAVVGALAWNNLRLARLAQTQRDTARYDAYVASMQTMAQKSSEGDGGTARRTLDALRNDPNRGWEWDYWKNAMDGGAKTLDWRGSGLPQIAADPRGTWLGVADAGSLTVYDLQGRRHARVALPHAEAPGYGVAAFRSGDRFLLQNLDTRLALVVDAPTGRVLRQRRLTGFIQGNIDWVSRDDRTTLTVSTAPLRTYRIDLDTLRETPLPQVPPASRTVFSSLTDRTALAEFVGGKYRLSIRRSNDWHEMWSATATRYLEALDIDPAGASVVVSDGGALKRFDVATGRALDATVPAGVVNALQFSPDGKRLLVVRAGAKVQELSVLDNLRPTRAFYDGNAAYTGGGRLLTAGDGVRLRDLRVPPASTTRTLFSGGNTGVYRLGERIVFFNAKGRFEIDANAPLRPPIPDRRKRIRAPGGDVTGRFAMSLEKDETTEFKDVEGVYPPLRIPNPNMYTWGNPVASPRGDRLAYSLDSTHLAVYDMSTGRRIVSLAGVSGSTMPRFSDDGRWLAVGDHAGNVGVWDASSWRRVASGRLGRDSVRCLAFSPDGGRVAAGSWSGDVGALDFRTGNARRFEGISQTVGDVAWSPDGRRLASGGNDREVRLWDAATGRDLGVIGRHDAEVNTLWFTRDGRTLCSVDQSGTLKLWSAGG